MMGVTTASQEWAAAYDITRLTTAEPHAVPRNASIRDALRAAFEAGQRHSPTAGLSGQLVLCGRDGCSTTVLLDSNHARRMREDISWGARCPAHAFHARASHNQYGEVVLCVEPASAQRIATVLFAHDICPDAAAELRAAARQVHAMEDAQGEQDAMHAEALEADPHFDCDVGEPFIPDDAGEPPF